MDLPADFDGDAYLNLYPDVKASGMEPLDHYLNHGRREGRVYKKGSPHSTVTSPIERYHPRMRGTIALEHLHRYAFACLHVAGKRVLDIASGEGYGSRMLAQTATAVYGVEIDPGAVAHASTQYKAPNLSFLRGSVEAIPLQDQSVDVVVSFETIEHLKDHDLMLREIVRVLTPDGVLFISTPDKDVAQKSHPQNNPFHKKELTSAEFNVLLRRHFRNVDLSSQSHLLGSAIFPKSAGAPTIRSFRLSDLPDSITCEEGLPDGAFLLAVCSNAALQSIPASFCSQELEKTDLVLHLRDALASARQELQFVEAANPVRKKESPVSFSALVRASTRALGYFAERFIPGTFFAPRVSSSSRSVPQNSPGFEQAHFIRDYTLLVDRLIQEHPQDRALAMARAVGSVTLQSYRILGDQQVDILKRMGLRDGFSMYDLACGSGRTAAALVRSGWRGHYKGADIIPALVEHLKTTCPGYDAVVHADLTIAMPDASVDIIYAWSLFTHLLHEETYLYLEDALRALKPGGVLVFSFLEFEMPGHWGPFENVMRERRHGTRTHMNAFLHRDQITLWARRLGYAGNPEFIDGSDSSVSAQGAFGQSLALLRKAI